MIQNNNQPLLVDTGSGFTIHYKDIYFYSTRNPEKQPLAVVEQTTIVPQTLIFVPSIGLGYGIHELLQRLPEKCHIVCIEYDEKLMTLARQHVSKELFSHKNLTVIRTADPYSAIEIFNHIPVDTFRRVISLSLSSGFRLYETFYKETEQLLQNKIQGYWKNKMTLIHMGKLYSKNLVDNLPLYLHAHDISELRIEKPVLVAGAGPSLIKTMDTIKEIRNDIIIIAVDTALPTLCGSKVYPDYVLALESQFVNILDFITDIPKSVSLIADTTSIPQVIRLFSTQAADRKVFLFSSVFHPVQILSRLKNKNILPSSIPPLGSVGVAAVYCALRMTSCPVCITGLDFSYPFSTSYSSGAPLPTLMLSESHRTNPPGQLEYGYFIARPRLAIKDKTGNPLTTDLVLSSYAENLKTLAKDSKRIIEISPFGMDLEGIKCYTPAEIRKTISVKAENPPQIAPLKVRNTGKINLIEFVRQEQKLIDDSIEKIESLLLIPENDIKPLSSEENEFFKLTDYVWFHLPHKQQFPRYSRAFLVQAMLYYRYFEKRLFRTLAALMK